MKQDQTERESILNIKNPTSEHGKKKVTKALIYISLKLILPPRQRCAFPAPCELYKFNILREKD